MTFRLVSTDGFTVTSPEGPDDLELALEPMPIRQARRFRKRCSRKEFRLPPSR